MLPDESLRIARSKERLDRLLSQIESGAIPKPDWIRLEDRARIGLMKVPERQKFLARIHACVRRGFRDGGSKPRTKPQRLAFWQSIARAGFHDFSEHGWMKNYDSPFVENYDYIEAFAKGGLAGLDPYKVYSAVLGTVDSRDKKLSELILQLQRFISGLSEDRQAIGASLTNIAGLADATAGLVQDARPGLKTDIHRFNLAKRTVEFGRCCTDGTCFDGLWWTPFADAHLW